MDNTFLKGKRNKFLLKIDLPALLAVILFAGMIFLYLIPGFEKVMMDRKRNLIHEMTSSVYSLLEHYHAMESEGKLDSLGAREEARSAITTIRYGDDLKDYFWITDMYPRMITHPYRPELNGKDLTGFRDSKGKAIFVEFVKAVTDDGDSYVEYMWQWNDDSTRVVPKLSYVRLFEPWGWVVGTGIYIEDVRTEIRRIELRALLISAIFGILIIALLVAISRQSHKIEQKKSKAEEDLRKSKELYRALAEAASEGVIIWSRQGLQANKTLISWVKYTEEELHGLTLSDILISRIITGIINAESLYEQLGVRQYIECQLKIKGGKIINAHADLSGILLGDLKAVLMVIRPGKKVSSQTQYTKPETLLDKINTGFFSLTYGRKPRFINATRPTLEILGYYDFSELQQQTLESIFVNSVQITELISTLEERKKIINKAVLLRKKNNNEFWALVNLMVVENESNETWCEGTIEPLAASSIKHDIPITETDTYGVSYMLEAPVSVIMRPPVECGENIPIARALALMRENNTDVIIVANKSGEPMGVINAGTAGFSLAEGTRPESEVFRIMHSPPDFIGHDEKISEAVSRIRQSPTQSLLVTKENRTAGVITNRELAEAMCTTPKVMYSGISGSESISALKSIFINSRKTAISMILGNADPYSVSLHISSVADAICRRIIEICIEEAGAPPCSFAFIQTGSAGRQEQSLLTDQDNGIIFEDVEGEQLRIAEEYFLPLGKKINIMLSDVGYHLCKGDNMAGNPKWCKPVNKWKRYFYDWIKIPGPSELLEISIFFDFRFCYGEISLTEELRDFVKTSLQTNDIFFYHMSMAWKQFSPSVAVLSEEKTDIKRVIMPLTGIIRLYALKYRMKSLSTIERILELYSEKHLDIDLARNALRAWKDLASIRLSHQASCITYGLEPDNTIDFVMRESNMRFAAAQAIEEINNLMLKAGNDFHSGTI